MQYTRAYLLALVGTTLMPHSSDKYVDLRWLYYLDDLNKTSSYAWGAAALTFTYKGLTKYATKKMNRFDLCVPLLQVWSFERIPVGRPTVIMDAVYEDIPVAIRWMTEYSKIQTDPHHNIPVYRNAMDLLTHDKVTWQPYNRIDQTEVPEYVVRSQFEIYHRAPLQSLDTVVGYYPDRCLPQFGMRQSIPRPPTLDLPTDTTNAWMSRMMPPYLITEVEEAIPDTAIYPVEYSSWYEVPRVFSTTLRYEEPRHEPTGYHEEVYHIYKSRCMHGGDIAENLATTMIDAGVPQQLVAQLLDLATMLRAPVPDHFTEADDPTAATHAVPVRGPSRRRWSRKESASPSQPCQQSPEAVRPSADPVQQRSEPHMGSSERVEPSSDPVLQSTEPRRWTPERILERSEPHQWSQEPFTHLSEPAQMAMETENTLGSSYPWGDPSTSFAMATGYSYDMPTTRTPTETEDIVNAYFSTPIYPTYGGEASSSYQYAPVQGMRPPSRAPVVPSEYIGYGEELGFVQLSTEQHDRGRRYRRSRRPHNYAHDHAYGDDCDTR